MNTSNYEIFNFNLLFFIVFFVLAREIFSLFSATIWAARRINRLRYIYFQEWSHGNVLNPQYRLQRLNEFFGNV